jgi:hypothetical protein
VEHTGERPHIQDEVSTAGQQIRHF